MGAENCLPIHSKLETKSTESDKGNGFAAIGRGMLYLICNESSDRAFHLAGIANDTMVLTTKTLGR